MSTVLVIAAHPDDEVLGCGGTIARHASNGDTVEVLILGTGATSRFSGADDPDHPDVQVLIQAAQKAAEILGARPPRFGDFPDNQMDSVPMLQVIKFIEGMIDEIQPACVYTHHSGDLNIDHKVLSNAVMTACRPLPGSPVSEILCFETPSSTEWVPPHTADFSPDHFVGIDQHLETKLKALEAYHMEMRPFPHARSYEAVEALAKWRGATVGLHAAEAFMTVRSIVR